MTIDSSREDELDLVGTELDGRYRIEKFVGAGTMGSVYKATQLAVGRRVAIKILNQGLKTHHEVRERFRVEAQAIALLSHPNCITLYDFGYSDRLAALYMVVEFLDGHTLEEKLAADIPADEALSIGFQIADVLAQAHEAGILHRDLKPENVMLVPGSGQSPNVKVLDFGLARIFEDRPEGTRLTRQGQLFGTPAYMSPEQCGGALDVGPAADVYALGITMFEMLQGRLPFVSNNIAEILVMHAREAPPQLECEAPQEVIDLVMQMLSKDPGARPTAPEVADALREFSTLAGRLPARAQKASKPPEVLAQPARKRAGDTAELEAAPVTASDIFDTMFPGDTKRRVSVLGAVLLFALAACVGLVVVTSMDDSSAVAEPGATIPGEKTVFEPVEVATTEAASDAAAHEGSAMTSAESLAVALRERAGQLAEAEPSSQDGSREASKQADPVVKQPASSTTKRSSTKPKKDDAEAPKTVRKLKFRY